MANEIKKSGGPQLTPMLTTHQDEVGGQSSEQLDPVDHGDVRQGAATPVAVGGSG